MSRPRLDSGSCGLWPTTLHCTAMILLFYLLNKFNKLYIFIRITASVSASPNSSRMSAAATGFKKFEIRKRNPDPKSAALLVIDIQNYFHSMAVPILPTLNATIDLCRRSSLPVFFTRHCHTPPDDDSMLHEWWNGDLIFEGTPDSQLIPDLHRTEADTVVIKNTYSAFRGTGLEERLKGMGVKEVIVTGVMTNLCCETTARDAFVRGFRVFFSTDATATSSQELHDATLKNMAYGFAYLVDRKRLGEAFSTT